MRQYYYVILWIPAGITLFQIFFLMVFFNVESPRFVFLQLKKALDESMINETSSHENSRNSNVSQTLLEKSKKIQLRSRFFNDPRMIKFANCFYTKEKTRDFLSFAFDEFSNALLKTSTDDDCIENQLGYFTLGWHPKYRTQFLICILLNFLNQATGINCLVMYSTNIFKQVGYTQNAELLTRLIGIIFLTYH
jgi:hypothetical protein